ncbi:MAG: glycoside hydrolase family 31 protein [Candidatus Binatia bacterium]
MPTRPLTTRRLLAALLFAGAAPAVRAAAATEPVTVAFTGGAVVVDRSPFALRVDDARGRTALASVRGVSAHGDSLYAPLALTLGDEPGVRYPALPGQPDPNPTDPPPAARYAAREVVAVTGGDKAARITLATDSPAGHTIVLEVSAGVRGSVRVVASAEPPDGVVAVAAAFRSGPDEAFHGFGGRRESTDLRGHTFLNWVLDYRYPDVNTAYYYVLPVLVSSAGYGLLLEQHENARWRLASDAPDAWQVAAAASSLHLVVVPGAPAQAQRVLSGLAGRHRVPPAWSIGPTLSRTIKVPGHTPETYQRAIEDDVHHIAHEGLPISAYAFEGWEPLPEAFVRRTIARLRRLGVHALLYIRSFVSDDFAGTEASGRFDEAIANGWVARTADGSPYLFPSPFFTSGAVIDFTNDAARAWWMGRVAHMLALGADGFMSDFGEQVLPDMVFADGSTGVTMHNRFPVLQSEATRAAFDRFVRRHPGRHPFFFSRAGYTGSAASDDAAFPGDETSDWSRTTGLPSIVPDMLNRAIAGAWGFTTDIPGYLDVTLRSPTKELYLRWSEAAALTPFFRVHNSPLTGVRMPWSYDEETKATWARMARLHLAARPLILALWRNAVRTGVPVVRPLWYADAQAEHDPHNDDEWLLGPDVLVAPVLAEGAVEREVRLPQGCWRLHGRGPTLRGGRTLTVPAPLTDLVWFVRCGRRPGRLARAPG